MFTVLIPLLRNVRKYIVVHEPTCTWLKCTWLKYSVVKKKPRLSCVSLVYELLL